MFNHFTYVLPSFLVACLVLAALPGPATMLCLHRTLRDGLPAGFAAVAGNEVGVFGWAIAGGAGLSMLLTANRVLSGAFHLAGAVTLVALGVHAWRGARRPGDAGLATLTGRVRRGRTPGAAFRASLLSIAANPKAAVFAISFLPQFLPRSGPLLPTLTALAIVQVLVDSAWTAGMVLLADRATTMLSRTIVRERLERALGAILIGLGLELAAQMR